jgi:hypothetical protein
VNLGALNTYTFGEVPYEPIVRMFVMGFCRALVATNARLFYKPHLDVQAEARLTGVIGRALARNIVEVAAEAGIDGPMARVDGRLVLSANGSAEIVHSLYAVRLRVSAAASAAVSLEAKVFARDPVFTVAEADVDLGDYMVRVRAPVSLDALAQMDVDGIVYPRRYIRSATPVYGVSIVALVPRAIRRSVVQSLSTVSVTGSLGHVDGRLAAAAQAQAVVDINLDHGVIRRIPWDEAAPEERQFLVVPEAKTFQVVV